MIKLDINTLKSLINNSHQRGNNIIGECPYCGKSEFGISIEEGHMWGCFRKHKCGETGNIYKLLRKVGRTDLIKGTSVIDLTEKLNYELGVKEEGVDLSLPIISPPIGFKRVFENEYLNLRGFVEYKEYRVGVTNLDERLKDYIIFLIEEDSQIVGYVGRNMKGEEPKYSNSITDFSKTVFGLDEIDEEDDTAILCEGIFSKLQTDRYLKKIKKEGIKCLCTFGGKVSIEQILKIKNKGINKCILFFEADIINQIKKHSFVLDKYFETEIMLPPPDKDPDDINFEEFIGSWDGRIKSFSFFLEKVQILKIK